MKLQGVVTTGIYCRASCPGRPAPRNVRPVRSGVEALAQGFRPCLICRPDRIANMGIPTPNAEIAQALRMVAEGYLDDASTDDLATRIGYSTRHLVRLFHEHVGASPDFVARSRRAHLARRLLDESDLSITDIAFAAGFSSIRQMNRVVRGLFAFSPSELRKKRRRGDRLEALDGGLSLRVPFEQPTDVKAMLSYLEARGIPTVEHVAEGRYRRTIQSCGHPGVIECQAYAADALQVTMHLPTFGSIIEHVDRTRRLFGLDVDNRPGRRILAKDTLLKPLVKAAPKLRLPGAYNRFETAVRIIVGQQVSVAGATTVTGRIAERHGQTIEALDDRDPLSRLFPDADTLAGAHLTKLGMPGKRAATITGFAKAVASGSIELDGAKTLDDTLHQLCTLPGIGPWTANLIAGRVMGYEDAFPASDLGLRKGAGRLCGLDGPMSGRDLEQLAERWRPFRFLAAAYLWTNTI